MRDRIFLIIHGFGGNIAEIDYLYKFLEKSNLNVDTLLLPGHGKGKKHLRKSTCKDWVGAVKEKIKSLEGEYHNIVLIGFSMGGLISTHFAHLPSVKKMVFINTPVYFWNIKIILKDLYSSIKNNDNEQLNYYKTSIFGIPLKSSIEFLKLLHSSKKLFSNIKVPLLVLQCKNDESVRYNSAKYIKEHTEFPTVILYDGGCHQVLGKPSPLREQICSDIHKFITSENTNFASL